MLLIFCNNSFPENLVCCFGVKAASLNSSCCMDQIITAALDLKYQRVDDILPILHLIWDYSESFAEILQDLEK